MKLLSFELAGVATYGLIDGDHIRVVEDAFRQQHPDLKSVLTANALDELQHACRDALTPAQAATLKKRPVLANPGKIFCVGLNYKTHVAETKRPDSEYPSIFTRFADSLAADGDVLVCPAVSQRFDFEGELAVVIGRGGRNISQAQALDHIAGYACFNDATMRDWQRHTHQWIPGKNFPGTGPFGPWLVTRDEVPNLDTLTLTTRLNGEVMQRASLADLIYTIPVIIEYLSTFTNLSPGDVIATGTPGGVGDRREPPLYMKTGDIIEVDITGLGTLRNTVRTETSLQMDKQ
jgi:2-keto-4-pentenoate hydratase/2-oxohepta-3-ene-1,7-dioic acid hydratase in catechol pathway